jgi:hypothetical protein
MKQAILTLLTTLTHSMKAESKPYHLSFLPIIQSALEPNSEVQVYLLEDSLELWSCILAQTPSAPEPIPRELLSLVQYLLPLYALGSESLRKALEITESYLLLHPNSILDDNFRPAMISSLSDLVSSRLRTDQSGPLTELMQTVIRAAEGLGGEGAVSVLVGDLISSSYLPKLLHGLHGAWQHHDVSSTTLRPDYPRHAVEGIIETDYLTILARICLASPTIFLEALKTATGDLEKTLVWLLEEWFSHIENVTEPPKKKLMCLALTGLLKLGQPWILGQLEGLMTMWTDVLTELLEGMDDKSAEYVFFYFLLSSVADI